MDKEYLIKYKSLILLILVVIISLVVVVLVLVPQLKSYWANRDKAPGISKQADVLKQKVVDLNSVDANQTDKDLKVVLTVLPKDQNVTDAVIIMQNLAALSGLGITQLGYTAGTKGEIGSFRISMGLSGQVTNVNDLLKKLNQSSRVIQVESIAIDSQTDNYDIKIPFIFYFKPIPTGNVPEDQPVQKLTKSEQDLIAKLTSGTDLTQNLQSTASAEIQLGKDDPFN